jgi:hypothetical protein
MSSSKLSRDVFRISCNMPFESVLDSNPVPKLMTMLDPDPKKNNFISTTLQYLLAKLSDNVFSLRSNHRYTLMVNFIILIRKHFCTCYIYSEFYIRIHAGSAIYPGV